MGKIIDSKVKDYIKRLLENSIDNGKTIAKLAILSDTFYNSIKDSMNLGNVSFSTRKVIMGNFINFIVQFETVCIKAYKPSGSGNTADDLINLYSKMQRDQVMTKTTIKSLN